MFSLDSMRRFTWLYLFCAIKTINYCTTLLATFTTIFGWGWRVNEGKFHTKYFRPAPLAEGSEARPLGAINEISNSNQRKRLAKWDQMRPNIWFANYLMYSSKFTSKLRQLEEVNNSYFSGSAPMKLGHAYQPENAFRKVANLLHRQKGKQKLLYHVNVEDSKIIKTSSIETVETVRPSLDKSWQD